MQLPEITPTWPLWAFIVESAPSRRPRADLASPRPPARRGQGGEARVVVKGLPCRRRPTRSRRDWNQQVGLSQSRVLSRGRRSPGSRGLGRWPAPVKPLVETRFHPAAGRALLGVDATIGSRGTGRASGRSFAKVSMSPRPRANTSPGGSADFERSTGSVVFGGDVRANRNHDLLCDVAVMSRPVASAFS